MSFVTLVLIKNKEMQIINAHYRVIKKIIEYCDFEIETVKKENKTIIDAGYILVDCDKKIIMNAQDAFYLMESTNFQKIII